MPPRVRVIFSVFPALETLAMGTAGLSASSAATSRHEGQQNTSPESFLRGWRVVSPHKEQVTIDFVAEADAARDIVKK
jgi:hypothetical protein